MSTCINYYSSVIIPTLVFFSFRTTSPFSHDNLIMIIIIIIIHAGNIHPNSRYIYIYIYNYIYFFSTSVLPNVANEEVRIAQVTIHLLILRVEMSIFISEKSLYLVGFEPATFQMQASTLTNRPLVHPSYICVCLYLFSHQSANKTHNTLIKYMWFLFSVSPKRW